jgi:hypothetical protein
LTSFDALARRFAFAGDHDNIRVMERELGRRRRIAALGLCALVALPGCVRDQAEARIDPVVMGQLYEQAAAQVKRCYRGPRVPYGARQIVTHLSLSLNSDGSLAELPAVLSQTGINPNNEAYAAKMAEAASLAVIKCAPYALPAEHYQALWSRFELVFSPKVAV